MAADILFEDFESSDFASRKRSTDNKQQDETGMFRPPVFRSRGVGRSARG